MKAIYVIGIPQVGGCWLSNEKCYSSYEAVQKQLDKEWTKDEEYANKNGIAVTHSLRIFTLYTED